MSNRVLEWMNRIVAVFLLLLGIFTLVISISTLEIGTFAKPKTGFAPTVFSVALIVFALINVIVEFVKPVKVPEKLKDVNWKKWALYLVICTVYVIIIAFLGFLISTLICLFFMLKISGQKGWIKPAIITLIFSFALWGIFYFALGIPLPKAFWA